MSKDEAISIALDSISEIKKFLKAADDLESSLKKSTKKKHLLKNSKQFIDDLYTISDKIKTNFYAQYDKLEKEVDVNSEDDGELVDESVSNIEDSAVDNSENVVEKDASENAVNTNNNASTEETSTNEATSEPKISDSDDIDVKPTFSKSIIRVVDLNKLIDPKQKKSVKFDSSVIILTSSDEEDTTMVPVKRNENGLKSSSKTSPDKRSENIDIFEPEVNIDEIKENSCPDNSRKSSRLKSVQIRKETKKVELKKIFKRSSDKNFEIISKRSKRNKDNKRDKRELSSEEKEIVLDSSSAESDSDSHRRGKTRKFKISDQKFKRKVYVPLPLIECHKLKEVYNTNKDIFACSSSTRSSKRVRGTSGQESDNENSKNKKTKTQDDKIVEERKSDDSSIKDNLENIDEDMPNEKEINAEQHKKKENKKGSGSEATEGKTDNNKTKTSEGSDKDEDGDKTDEDEKTIKRNKEATDEVSHTGEDNSKEKEDTTKTGQQNDLLEEDEGKKIDEDQDTDKESTAKKGDSKEKKIDEASVSTDDDKTAKENSDEKIDETDEGIKTTNIEKSTDKNRESDEEISTNEAESKKKKNTSKTGDESANSDEEGSEKKTEGRKSRNKTKPSDKDRESDEETSTKETESEKKKNKSKSSDESANSDEEGSEKKTEGKKSRNKTRPSDKDRESDEENSTKETESKKQKNKSKSSDESANSDEEGSEKKTKGRKSKNKTKPSDKDRESDEENSTKETKSKKKKNKSKSSDESANSDEEGSEKKMKGRKSKNKTKPSDKDRESDEENSMKETKSKKKKNKSKSSDESANSDEEDSEKKTESRKSRNKTKSSDKDRESDGDDDSINKEAVETKPSDDESVNNDEIPKNNKDNDSDEETDLNTSKTSDNEDEVKKKNKKKKKNDSDESDGEQTEEDRKKVKKEHNSDSDSDDDNTKKKTVRKTTKKSHKLVIISDSDDEEEKRESDDDDSDDSDKKKTKKKTKKKIKKPVVIDSDDEDSNKKSEDEEKSDSSSNSDEDGKKSDSDDESPKKKAQKKSRIKKSKNSSSESEEEVATRKKLRQILGKDSLSETTKKAEEEERDRKARIAEKQKKYNRMFEEKKDVTVESVVLDYHEKTKEPRISVHKKIVKNLKPHQVSGIQFMYDACFESVERTMKSPGSGCILAHCMGLGKTLQVVALTHTLLKHSDLTKVERVMVVCPINTVLNWKAEYKKWMPKKSELEVYELATSKKNYERQHIVKEWYEDGGILIIGYTMFRNLSNPANKRLTKKMRTDLHNGLVDPGPDLVICDEGHLLKNEKTHLSIAMNRIKTLRRIVLTGTPLQNNLKEYWCMVQFIKPNLLGTYKEYMNRFVNPITNGQYTDSTQHDTILMRKRSHVLHKLLDGVVQRRDYAVLEPYLPTKHEYVLFVKLSDTQIKLYKYYMEKLAKKNDGSNRTSFLFTDFQQLQRICTHPRVLADKTKEKKEKWDDEDEDSEGSLKDFINDDEDSGSKSSASSSSNESDVSIDSVKKKKPMGRPRVTRALAAQRKENNDEDDSDIEMISEVKKEWYQEFCDGDELDNIDNSGKLSLFFAILKECEEIGDKVLVFSQSLYTLNCLEYFLGKIDEATSNNDTEKLGGYKGTWELGLDYFRLDGSSSCDNRAYWCDSFNNPDNERARLFLISTRAGGLGINLVAANRVIIFDVSWNPSHDLQSIYRVYRFGQTKPCYIYRFVTYGAMEMKIYERQVTKQAISKRVIDEQQIDRHYNQNDLQELYQCDLDPEDRPIPMVPKDVLLGEMLQKYDKVIYKYHLHQSLLENKHEEGLNEEERKAAWDEFENEKVLRKTTLTASSYLVNTANMSAQAINAALTNIVKRDNPNWSEAQIKGIIPALVRQLQIQIEENDMSMYQRVVQEIQIMNQAKLKESYYQQQMMKYYQQQMIIQKRQQAMMGNLSINPAQIQNLFGGNANVANYMNGAMAAPMAAPNFANGPSTSRQNRLPNDVIELND